MSKIAKALHEVMMKVGYVQRTGKNAFHGYKYAGESDLLEKLRPAMLEAGLILIPSVTSVERIDEHGNTTVRVEYTLVHKDGEVWPDKIGAAGCGGDRNKNGVGDKGLYKALTGANKYLLFKLFQIETGDDPETYEPAPEPAKQTISERALPSGPAAPPVWSPEEEEKKVTGMLRGIQACVTIADIDAFGKQPEAVSVYARCSEAGKSKIKNALRNQRDKIAPPSMAGAA